MYKKEIKYEDLNGNEIKETFTFHYNKKELTVMNLEVPGGLQGYIEKISNTQDIPELIKLFQKLILSAYGVPSDDGKRFIKVKDGHKLAEDFEQTEAYSELFMLLATDAKEAEKFINQCIPQSLVKEIEAEKRNASISAIEPKN